MVQDARKLAIGGGFLAATLGLIYLVTKAKAIPPEQVGAAVQIEVIGAQSHSPVVVEEGRDYPVKVTVTNLSTRAGAPWEADFHVIISAATDWTTLISPKDTLEHFSAGQTRSFSYTMRVPVGSGGESGSIVVTIADPDGVLIVYADELVMITTVEIIYGATVVIGT